MDAFNDSSALVALFSGGLGLFWLAMAIFSVVVYWKIFVKAGKPGWAGLIPIYNVVVLLEIIGKPIWWLFIIIFVPVANIIFSILMMIELSKRFGKETGFAIGMILLPIIFMAILAFGSAEYTAPVVETPQA